VDENTSGINGNGIYNTGNLELTDGSIEQNTVGAAGGTKGGGRKGGGIYNNTGTVIARQILLQDNASGGGGGIDNRGIAHFYNSALVTNEATNGQGGGVFNFGTGAGLLMNNGTVSANIAIFGGGGIRNEDGAFQLMFVTIYSNESEGINSSGSGEMKMRNTILSTNMDGNCAGTNPDSIGHNIDDGNSCLLDALTDLTETDPMLLPLAMNGSIRPTNALAAGSPAIDSADPDRCDGTDQRLVTRPQGANCDRGAYEKSQWQPAERVPSAERSGASCAPCRTVRCPPRRRRDALPPATITKPTESWKPASREYPERRSASERAPAPPLGQALPSRMPAGCTASPALRRAPIASPSTH
jgi:hypothetical protein